MSPSRVFGGGSRIRLPGLSKPWQVDGELVGLWDFRWAVEGIVEPLGQVPVREEVEAQHGGQIGDGPPDAAEVGRQRSVLDGLVPGALLHPGDEEATLAASGTEETKVVVDQGPWPRTWKAILRTRRAQERGS